MARSNQSPTRLNGRPRNLSTTSMALSLAVGCLVAATWTLDASAQVTAEGRAFGSTNDPGEEDALGSNSDTGTQTAVEGTPEDSFDVTTSGGLNTEDQLVALDGQSSTTGLADGVDSFVDSVGRNASATIVGAGVSILGATATASASCGADPAVSTGVTLLSVNGSEPIAVPESVTGTITSQDAIGNESVMIEVNRRFTSTDPATGAKSAEATFVRVVAQGDPGTARSAVAGARASLENLPLSCFPGECEQDFSRSTMRGTVTNDADGDGNADAGDVITYEIELFSRCTATGVEIVARIPKDGAYVDGSLRLEEDGTQTPISGEIRSCGDLEFPVTSCNEQATNAERDCLFFSAGDFDAEETKFARFDVEARATEDDFVCSQGILAPGTGQEVKIFADVSTGATGDGGGDGDGDSGSGGGASTALLGTTGSGGCSVGPNGNGASGLLPFLSLVALILGRKARPRR